MRLSVLNGGEIVAVTTAHHAARMLRHTYEEVLTQAIVDQDVIVGDASAGETGRLARDLQWGLFLAARNRPSQPPGLGLAPRGLRSTPRV